MKTTEELAREAAQHLLDLAYAAARESERYWRDNDPNAKRWVESDTYKALCAEVDRFRDLIRNEVLEEAASDLDAMASTLGMSFEQRNLIACANAIRALKKDLQSGR